MLKTVTIKAIAALLLAVVSLGHQADAQIYWLKPPSDGPTVYLDGLKADFQTDAKLTTLTSVWTLAGRVPITNSLAVWSELPFSNYDETYEHFNPDGERMIGNPYLGVEVALPGISSVVHAGVRFPLAGEEKEDAIFAGAFTTYDRIEAFAPDRLTVAAAWGFQHALGSNATVRAMLGPSAAFATGGEGETELFADYNAELWAKVQRFAFGFGLTGKAWLTEENLDAGERFVHQIGFAGNVALGPVRPGLQFRLPLGTALTDAENFVYGVNLTIGIE